MRTKFRLACLSLFIVVAFSTQFISCSKDSGAGNKVNSNTADNSTETALSSALVAWYTFNGDVLDHSGNNNNVAFNNATPAAGKKGVPNTAYLFDGSTTYMRVPNSSSLNPTGEITLEAHFKPMGFYQGQCHSNRVFDKGTADQSDGVYFLGYDDMKYYNYQGCNDTIQNQFENFYGNYGDNQFHSAGVRSRGYIEVNKWYTLVFTYDGDSAKLYINGTLRATDAQTASFTPNSTDLYIGKMPNAQYPYWFNGVIDEIKIYKKALSADRISKLSN